MSIIMFDSRQVKAPKTFGSRRKPASPKTAPKSVKPVATPFKAAERQTFNEMTQSWSWGPIAPKVAVAVATPKPAKVQAVESEPTEADRAEWSMMSPANRVNYFVEGEPRRFARKPSTRQQPTRQRIEDECEAVVAEFRPGWAWLPTSEWDEYEFKANQVERRFGIRH